MTSIGNAYLRLDNKKEVLDNGIPSETETKGTDTGTEANRTETTAETDATATETETETETKEIRPHYPDRLQEVSGFLSVVMPDGCRMVWGSEPHVHSWPCRFESGLRH